MSSDLFEFTQNNSRSVGTQSGPLAYRMRPTRLEEFTGQEKILSPGKPLRQWIEADRVPSLILWGPPGCGKTTLAQLIANHTQSEFEALSAVLSGVKEIKETVARAKESRRMAQRKTLLFVDEIHRFNKTQQDALLPHVEDGTVTLIGATTENPSFEISSALLSRVRVIRLEPLSQQAIASTLQRALLDPMKGLGDFFKLSEEAMGWLAQFSEGDARRALTALESIALIIGQNSGQNSDQKKPTQTEVRDSSPSLTLEQVKDALESTGGKQPLPYDSSGEEHYNTISAFIKSIRDSDPHAGLYYLARMLTCGEDPLFIARRLVILASEDVGNADPRGLTVALNAKEAVEFVGMPEARISLAQAVTYLALAPKSNASYHGIEKALAEVQQSGALPIPMHLRNYGQGYQYAHSNLNARVQQTHLPDSIVGKRFYHPKEIGLEKQLKSKLDELNPSFEPFKKR